MNLLRLAWKNILYKPLSTLLSLLLFGLGIGLVSLLLLLESQLQKNFENNLAGIDLVIGAKGSPLQLILSSMYHIDTPTGNVSIEEVRPFLNPNHPIIKQAVPLSMGDSYQGYRIVGTTQELLDLYEVSLAEGDLWKRNLDVTVGAAVAEALDLRVGDTFQSSHGYVEDEDLTHEDAAAFTVVGILAASGTVVDQLLLTTPQSFWLVHEGHEDHDHDHGDHDHGDHDEELRTVPSPLREEDGDREITSLLLTFKGQNFQALNMQRGINDNTDLQAATPAIEITRLFNLFDTGERALRILAIVIIIVSALSVFISLYASLRDRSYELALMRVKGARPAYLALLIMAEGVLLAFLGFLLGLLLSHGGMELLAQLAEKNYRYSLTGWQFLPAEWILLLGALVIGLVAAIIPAIRASQTDIANTLTRR